MKRRHSEISLRQAFPAVLNYEIERLDEELAKIETSFLVSNRRHLFSILGTVLVFLLLFFTTGQDIVYGMFGALIGLCIGYILGKRIRGKIIHSTDLDKLTQYQLRLTCSIIYLKKLRKERIPIADFSALLEKIIDDFRPALLHPGRQFERQIYELIKFLKSSAVHIVLLNSLIDLNNDIESGVLPCITAVRIIRFYLPILEILSDSKENQQNELEIVKRIREMLEDEKTKRILKKINILDEETIKFALPHTGFAVKLVTVHAGFCRLLSTVENFMRVKSLHPTSSFYVYSNKLFVERLRFRRMSLTDSKIFEKKRQLSYRDYTSLRLLFEVQKSHEDVGRRLNRMDSLLNSEWSFTSMNIRRSILRNPTVAVVRKRRSMLFEGHVGDLHQDIGEEDEEDSVLIPIHTKLSKKSYDINGLFKGDLSQPSRYRDYIDFLLAMESQPKPEIIWKKVLNCTDFQVYVQKNLGSVISVRSYCSLSYSVETVFRALWDPETRLNWDSFLTEFHVLDEAEDHQVVYIAVKTPSALGKRDLVQRRIKVEDYPDAGMICMHYTSVEHELAPIRSEYIRAETLVAGIILRPDEMGSQVTMITKTNIKGVIPIEMFAKIASRSPQKWFNELKQGCEAIESM